MPFEERSAMSVKREFVVLAQQPGANLSTLCRRFGISRPTGYRWLGRDQTQGEAGLVERTRRPETSPAQTPAAMETLVLAIRDT